MQACCCHRVLAPTTGQRQWQKRQHTSISLLSSQSRSTLSEVLGPQLVSLDRCNAEEATYFCYTPKHAFQCHRVSAPQRGYVLLLHLYAHSYAPHMLSDATGSQLIPLDRRNGRTGDILLLHALPPALVQQSLGRGPGLHPPSHDVG